MRPDDLNTGAARVVHRKRLPSGSSFGQNRRAIAAFTMATPHRVSVSRNGRPP
jgi:hypothetical protein